MGAKGANKMATEEAFFAKFVHRLKELKEKNFPETLCIGCTSYLEHFLKISDKISVAIKDPLLVKGLLCYLGRHVQNIYLSPVPFVDIDCSYSLVVCNQIYKDCDALTILECFGLLSSKLKESSMVMLRERVRKNKTIYPPLEFYNNMTTTLGFKTLKSHLTFFNKYNLVCMVLLKL